MNSYHRSSQLVEKQNCGITRENIHIFKSDFPNFKLFSSGFSKCKL